MPFNVSLHADDRMLKSGWSHFHFFLSRGMGMCFFMHRLFHRVCWRAPHPFLDFRSCFLCAIVRACTSCASARCVCFFYFCLIYFCLHYFFFCVRCCVCVCCLRERVVCERVFVYAGVLCVRAQAAPVRVVCVRVARWNFFNI